MMQAIAAAWAGIRALCVCLVMALALAVVPAVDAAKQCSGAMVAEADHRSIPAEHGHPAERPYGHHDTTDHDHVGPALLEASASEVHTALPQSLRPEALAADSMFREGLRRPPRLTMT